jgi:hypothetical protein
MTTPLVCCVTCSGLFLAFFSDVLIFFFIAFFLSLAIDLLPLNVQVLSGFWIIVFQDETVFPGPDE